MKNSETTVGSRLKEERIRLGYSVRKFAEAAGVALSTQVRYESDENVPGSGYMNRISALGAEVFWILRGSAEDDANRDKSASPYTPTERALIDNYRLCPEPVQASVRTLIAEAAKQKAGQVQAFRDSDKKRVKSAK